MSNCLGVSVSIDPLVKVKKIDDLVDLPKVVVVNNFDEPAAKQFRKDFQDAVNTGQNIVPVVIDSYGGQVYSLFSMCETILHSPIPVATICTGKSMSCGAVLLTCGTEGYRYIGEYSTVLIHEVSGGNVGKASEIEVKASEIERLNEKLFNMMALNIGKPKNYFLDLIHENNHADLYFDAEQAISHNLANHIGTPGFNVRVKTEIAFG